MQKIVQQTELTHPQTELTHPLSQDLTPDSLKELLGMECLIGLLDGLMGLIQPSIIQNTLKYKKG